MADREFKPGIEIVPAKPQMACIWSAKLIGGVRYRCTDAAVEDEWYCALHKSQRDAERAARKPKPKPWWIF